MKKIGIKLAILMVVSLVIVACEDDEPHQTTSVNMTEGLYIVNEGNWGAGNATVSYYNPQTKEVKNEVFYLANGMRLGDVAQSMTVSGNVAWIVVNNSNVVYAVDVATMKELGRVDEGLVSPRAVCVVSADKVYVSQMYSNKIAIVDIHTYEVTGYIECSNMDPMGGSTEVMVKSDGYVYVSCWSYQKEILKIDIAKDEVVSSVEVGVQPSSLIMDKNGKLWTLTDGGYEGNPLGYVAPELVRVDAKTMMVEKRYTFTLGDYVSDISLSVGADTIYWLNNDLYRMSIDDDTLPTKPFLDFGDTYYYSMTVAPKSGDIYVSDAIDYIQSGVVYRYNSKGEYIDDFVVGVCPGYFSWQ